MFCGCRGSELICCQVFHGAESDIVWLQKDFDIYVVNLFDTYHATKVLGKLCSRLNSGD